MDNGNFGEFNPEKIKEIFSNSLEDLKKMI